MNYLQSFLRFRNERIKTLTYYGTLNCYIGGIKIVIDSTSESLDYELGHGTTLGSPVLLGRYNTTPLLCVFGSGRWCLLKAHDLIDEELIKMLYIV